MEIITKRFSDNSVKSGITKTWLTLRGQLQKHLHTYDSLSLGDIEMNNLQNGTEVFHTMERYVGRP